MTKYARRIAAIAASLSIATACLLWTAQPASAAVARSVVDVPYTPGVIYNSPLRVGADVDGDGHDDVVIAQGKAIVVYPGNADGLAEPVTSPFVSSGTGTAWTRILAAGDVTGDGAADLIVAESTAPSRIQLVLLRSDGASATFGSPTALAGPTPANAQLSSTIGDVDGDGHADVIVTRGGGFAGTSWLLHNAGDGTLAEPALLGSTGYSPQLVDLDGDDANDLVGWDAAVVSDDQLRAFVSDPSAPVASTSYAGLFSKDAKTDGRVALVADLTGDGHADLVTQDGAEGGLAASTGPGTFATATPLGFGVSNAGAVDVDADGDLDPLALDEVGALHVAVNEGQGNFTLESLGDLPKGVLIPVEGGRRLAILHDIYGDAPTITLVTFDAAATD